MEGTLDPEKVKGKILACLRGKNVRVDKGQQVALAGCTYPFFKPTLERASINYLSLIKYLQDQPIEPNPLKVSHVAQQAIWAYYGTSRHCSKAQKRLM